MNEVNVRFSGTDLHLVVSIDSLYNIKNEQKLFEKLIEIDECVWHDLNDGGSNSLLIYRCLNAYHVDMVRNKVSNTIRKMVFDEVENGEPEPGERVDYTIDGEKWITMNDSYFVCKFINERIKNPYIVKNICQDESEHVFGVKAVRKHRGIAALKVTEEFTTEKFKLIVEE